MTYADMYLKKHNLVQAFSLKQIISSTFHYSLFTFHSHAASAPPGPELACIHMYKTRSLVITHTSKLEVVGCSPEF